MRPASGPELHLALFLLVGLLAGCSGPTVVDAPPDFPLVTASWEELLTQAPAEARALVVVSLDEFAERNASEILSLGVWQSGLASQLGDVLGVDLDEAGVFRQLGLRFGGGAALFLLEGMWIGVVDLENPALLEAMLRNLEQRNPDLLVSKSEHRLGDLFVVSLFGEEHPSVHALLTDTQLIVTFPATDDPLELDLDDVLLDIGSGDWPQNARYNPFVQEALAHFGGDAWGLGFAETSPVLDFGGEEVTVVGDDDACLLAEEAIATVVPYVLLAITHDERTVEGELQETKHQRFHFAIAAERQSDAQSLLRPSPVNPAQLRGGVIAAGFLNVDTDALMTLFSHQAPARVCDGPASALGWVGYVAQYLKSTPEPLSGFVLGALFDVRTTGGVPFIDAYVEVGSAQPAALSAVLQRALEEQLGAAGTPDSALGMPIIRYRVGLLYRLTLYHGASALGLSLGRVDEGWLETAMDITTTRSDSFLHLIVNGSRLLELMDVAMGFAGMGLEDPDVLAAQEALFADERTELEALIDFVLSATYRNGFVRFDSVTTRRP